MAVKTNNTLAFISTVAAFNPLPPSDASATEKKIF